MWKEMRKGKCKTKKKRQWHFFFLCTLHLEDGRGEKGSERGRERLKMRKYEHMEGERREKKRAGKKQS